MGVFRAALCALALTLLPPVALAQEPPVPVVRFVVEDFAVEGDNPLSEAATRAALADYAGEYSGLDGLLAAADALEQALAEAGYGFHRVSLPPQTLDGGTVTLKVVRFRLGKVEVEGNRFFPSGQVLASLPALEPGTTPDTERVARAVAVANRHPARKASVSMRQGEAPDTVDAVVKVRDQRPWSAFAVLNNIGTSDTGRSRVSLGAQHADLFGRDHVLTASWTTSPQNAGDVRQWGLSYQVPVYALSGWLTLTRVRSEVNTGQVQQIFDVSGAGSFWGLSFRQELRRRGALRHAWTLALQDRKFENDARFTAGSGFSGLIPAGAGDVRSRPLSARWEAEHVREGGSLRGYLAYWHNLWGGTDNDDASYGNARAGAKRDWNAVRFGASATQSLGGKWLARARLDGQWAGEPLIPGEQFGIGGASSVRGFEERAVAADNGFTASLETWAPPIRQLADVRLLAFLDLGYKDLEPTPAQAGQATRDTLLSLGFGARWRWRESFSLSVDYGRVILHAEDAASDRGNTRWHLSMLYRY